MQLLLDTRFNSNEGMETLNKDVRKFGKMLRSFVKFFVAFFLFTLLNLCLDLFTKHTQLLSVETFRLLEGGLRAFVNQNVLAFISILSEHNLFAAVAVAFACVFGSLVVAHTFATVHVDCEADNQVREHKQDKQECASVPHVVSYRQKVCFLS